MGIEPYIIPPLPHFRRQSRKPDPENSTLIAQKLKVIVERKYSVRGPTSSFMQFFAVPKADNIWLVYNGSSCGLNASLWAPNFWLPTARSATRVLSYNYFSVDMDVGEIFLNFPFHPKLQFFSGVDLTPFKDQLGCEGVTGRLHYRWCRTWMGSRPSPHGQ
jgi:hypothetical protein